MQSFFRALATGLALLFVGLQGAMAADLPPIEAFGKLPNIRSVILSPGGTHFAAVRTYNGAKALAIYDIYGEPGKNLQVLTFEGSDEFDEELRRIFWVNDDRLVAVMEIPYLRWETQVQETRMFAMNADLTGRAHIPKRKNLPTSKSGRVIGSVAQIQDRVLHMLPDDQDNIVLQFDREGLGRQSNVYHLNVYTGGLKKILSGGPNIGSYVVGSDGKPYIRARYNKASDEFTLEYRKSNKGPWREILTAESDGLEDYELEAFGDNPDTLYVSKVGESRRNEIFKLDLTSSQIAETAFAHDTYDIGGLITDDYDNKVLGYWYQDHRTRAVYADETWKQAQEQIGHHLPGRFNRLQNKDKTGSKWVVRSSKSNQPTIWYLYLAQPDRMLEIGHEYPALKGRTLSLVEPFSYEARDGMTIPGYLTKPKGQGPFPTVVLPHGGPNARDTMSFNYEVQFLASRGYAVFQPNFRGSSGYGKDFEEAGHHQWGLAMQDDVTDGTRALIARGLADPERICIVGGSYGGYAALMGAVKTPDLYQCAVSFGGVSDIRKLLTYWDKFKFSSGNDPRIGDKWDDRGRIRDTAPINNVDAIKVPILLMHGENDRTVPVEQSKLMAARLKKAKKPHKLVIFKGGDHNHSFEKNRIQYLRELETFLAEHIGG